MLKRLLSLVLAVLLVSGLVPTALGEGEPSSLDLTREGSWYQSAALHNGEVLLGAYDAIYKYVPGETEIKEWFKLSDAWREKIAGYESFLLNGEQGELYIYSSDPEKTLLYPATVTAEGIELGEAITLTMPEEILSTVVMEGYMERPAQMLIYSGRLYLLYKTWGPKGSQISLVSFDAAKGGEGAIQKAEFIQRIAAYQDGKLLALELDDQNAWDPQTQQMKSAAVVIYDPATGEKQPLMDTGFPFQDQNNDLLYDAASDTLYLQAKGEVYRRVGEGPLEKAAYLNPNWGGMIPSGQFLLLSPGTVMVLSGESVSVRTTDPAQLPSVRLTIYGTWLDDSMKKAIQAMNNVPVTFLESKWFADAQQLGQALVSGEDEIDIFFLNADAIDLNNLMSKGYTADLSASTILNEFTSSTYSMMQEMGKLNGKLYMVPVEVQSDLQAYYPLVFEQLGLEVPTTYAQMADLYQDWNDSLAEEHPDVILTRTEGAANQMLSLAFQVYADKMGGEGKEFSFADPLLRQLVDRASKLNLQDIEMKVNWEDPASAEAFNEMYNKAALLEPNFWLDLYNLNRLVDQQQGAERYEGDLTGAQAPLVLKADDASKPYAALNLRLAAVNPKSKNAAAAIQFLETYVQNMMPAARVLLDPSMNDPIPNPQYDVQVGYMEEGKASMEKALADAEGAEKTQLQAEYDRMMKIYESEKERMRYIAKPETIQLYRSMAENAYIRTWDGLRSIFSTEDMQKLLGRFLEKQIDLDQFLNEAQSKLRLMRLENQ